MLYDKDFLKQLDSHPNKIIYARITSLNLNEQPIERIEGKITSGSVNIDGTSAIRRTCNLSMIAQGININEYYWGLKTKFQLEIGLKNSINIKYPEIIWFPLGIYVITNFSTNLTINNYVINISGKDKMCLLNGENGGILNSTIDFGTKEIIDINKNINIKKIPIKDIIRESVHQYGNEFFHNIIINDLEEQGLELLEYQYDSPMYLYRKYNSDEYIDSTLNQEKKCYIKNEENFIETTFKDIKQYDSLIMLENPPQPTEIYFPKIENGFELNEPDLLQSYAVAKIEYGETAGYHLTNLIFAGDLISNPGDSLTSVLDKIVNMLGNFEYFYDLQGRFVFQKKKNYINTFFSPQIKNGNESSYVESLNYIDKYSYNFNDTLLTTSFSNSPQFNNLKNDFSVWGTRQSVNDTEIPILMRYAIDEKPSYYKTITVFEEEVEEYNKIYNTQLKKQDGVIFTTKNTRILPDDGKQYIEINDYIILTSIPTEKTIIWKTTENNSVIKIIPKDGNCIVQASGIGSTSLFACYEDGEIIKTYEIEVIEKIIEVDWREIIYQMAIDFNKFNHLENFELKLIEANKDKNLYVNGKTGYEPYYIDMLGFWRQLYNPEFFVNLNGTFLENDNLNLDTPSGYLAYSVNADLLGNFYLGLNGYEEEKNKKNFYSPEEDTERKYWLKQVYNEPEKLNFWIDFLDSEGELSKYSNKAIGNRSIVKSDNAINAIYYKNTPNIIFSSQDENVIDIPNSIIYKKFNTPNLNIMFSVSSQGKSAKDTIDELLYNHSYCIDSININTIPIYYLEPNTRIYVYDEQAKIEGEYIIDRISLSLKIGDLMSISAHKAVKRLM